MTTEAKQAELIPAENDEQPTEVEQTNAIQAAPPAPETPANPPNMAPSAVQIGSAFDIAPEAFMAGLDRRAQNREALMRWIKDGLVEGRDWGKIHVVKKDKCKQGAYCSNPYHFSKPSLWKSGAESICGMLGLRSTWPNLEDTMRRVEDGKLDIVLKCHLLAADGSIISEGIGARSLNTDNGDMNKALKMAKKSGLIDAALNLGLSEIFTQDIDDMDPDGLGEVGDPYNAAQERGDNFFEGNVGKPVATHCPIGAGKGFKGKPWAEVDDGFLNWIVNNIDDKPELVAAARKELEGRSLESQEKTAERRDSRIRTKDLGEYVREIGSAKTVEDIARIRKELPADFLPSVRAFLAKREVELRDAKQGVRPGGKRNG